jgi:succinoglycan biosynthesis protein ExoA
LSQVNASVLVPVLNEEAHIRETVAAMQRQDFDGTLEFLFMDGRSDDGTRRILEELAREDPRVRVLDNPGRTTAKALNVGLENARGEYVVRMDAHAFYPPRYIAAGVERLSAGDVDWVAGPAIPHGEGRWSRRVALALNSGLSTVGSRKWHENEGSSAQEVELDTGVFAGVWRRETLERHGGWNPDWPINQDSELAARVLAAGGRIVLLPEMGARYIPRDSLKGLARQYFRYGFYRAKTSRYHANSMRRSHLMAPGVATAAVASLSGPRFVAVPARAVVGVYAAGVLAASAREAARGRIGDALGLPVVYAIMHLAWGFGCLVSWLRFGPPLAALARVAGFDRTA